MRHHYWTCVLLVLLLVVFLGAPGPVTAQLGRGFNPFAGYGIGQAPQIDFSGDWAFIQNQDNTEETILGDWTGLPLSEAGIARSEAWDPAIDFAAEWQCRPQGWSYVYRALQTMRIAKEIDPVSREVIGFRIRWQFTPETVIYLDGRPHPPDYAPHTWMGFSTAVWEGDLLKIRTTHLKENFYRRNGVFSSDQRTETSYWIRRGDVFSWITIDYDRVMFTEPLIRSGEFRLTRGLSFPLYPCTPAYEGGDKGRVPAFFPGTNSSLHDAAKILRVPEETLRAGAAAMYPEYQAKLRRQ